MTVKQDIADADLDPTLAVEVLEAVRDALFKLDPTHSQTEKGYPGAENWVFGWLTEPELSLEARHAWSEVHALQIARAVINTTGRGRRIRLTVTCARDGHGTVQISAKPLPVHPPPPGGYEELGQQLVQSVTDRLHQLEKAPSVAAFAPEGLAAQPGLPFRVRPPFDSVGIEECAVNIRDSLGPGLSILLQPIVTGNGQCYVEVTQLGPIEAN